jgi:hypothetical protein
MCQVAEKSDKEGREITLQDDFSSSKHFSMPVFGGIFNIFEFIVSLGNVHPERAKSMPMPTPAMFADFLIATCFPFVPLFKVYSAVNRKESDKKVNGLMTVIYASMFVLMVALFASMGTSRGLRAFAWTAMLINACLLTNVRRKYYHVLDWGKCSIVDSLTLPSLFSYL